MPRLQACAIISIMKTLLERWFPNVYLAYLNWKVGGASAAFRAVRTLLRFAVKDTWNLVLDLFRSKQIAILAFVTTLLVLVGLATPEVSATTSIVKSRLFEMLMKWNFILVPSFAGYAIYYAFGGHAARGKDIPVLSEEWERKHRIMATYIVGTMIAWALQLRL